MVACGRDGIGQSRDRGWDMERLYDPDPDHPGTSCTRRVDSSMTPASSTPRSLESAARGAGDGSAAAALIGVFLGGP